jgi:hypothetical protein
LTRGASGRDAWAVARSIPKRKGDRDGKQSEAEGAGEEGSGEEEGQRRGEEDVKLAHLACGARNARDARHQVHAGGPFHPRNAFHARNSFHARDSRDACHEGNPRHARD